MLMHYRSGKNEDDQNKDDIDDHVDLSQRNLSFEVQNLDDTTDNDSSVNRSKNYDDSPSPKVGNSK